MSRIKPLLIALCVVWPATAVPENSVQQFVSGPDATVMLELFTSQGCSSCPPAERWLSGLAEEPGLWERFIPLAWHVDYWDYLGWRDVFSSPANTQRQRRYAALDNLATVYTPAVVRDGQEWRRWHWGGPLLEAPRPAVGRLRLALDGTEAHIRFEPGDNAPSGALTAHLALLGHGYQTDIQRGENRGRKLAQDFVVLGRHQVSANGPEFQLGLPAPVGPTPARFAVVAWLSKEGNPSPVQAVGGWLHSQP